MAKVEPPSTPRDGSSNDPQALDTELSLTADATPSGAPEAAALGSAGPEGGSPAGGSTPDALGLTEATLDLDLGGDLAIAAQDHIAHLNANQDISVVVALDARDSTELPIDDAAFMADARFVREGADLLLIKPDGTAVLIENYFAADIRPDVIGPNGQLLSPHLVDAFLEPVAAGQVASSDAAQVAQAQGQPIGTVDSLTGEVWAVRPDGTRVLLEAGDSLFQGDVIETGDQGSIKMSFVDNTLFSLDNDARLALDEMVYDPASGSGESAFSILKGGFLFVSGQIAQTNPNDMTVTTPVATIGIRGTGVTGNVTLDGGTFTILNGAISVSVPGQPPVILETTFESVSTEPGDDGQFVVQQFQETAQAVIARNATVFRNLSDSDLRSLETAIKEAVAEENEGVDADDVNLDIQQIVDSVPVSDTSGDDTEDAEDAEEAGEESSDEEEGADEEAGEEGEDGADAGEEVLEEELVEDTEVEEVAEETDAETDDEVNDEELAAVENAGDDTEQTEEAAQGDESAASSEETNTTNVTDGSSDTTVEGASSDEGSDQQSNTEETASGDDTTQTDSGAVNVTEDASSTSSTSTSSSGNSSQSNDIVVNNSNSNDSGSVIDDDDTDPVVVGQVEDNSPISVSFSSFSSSGTYNGATETRDTTVDASSATSAVNITTGTGADTVTGGTGNDTISSGAGNDSVTAGDGDDTVELGSGNDTAVAGTGRGNDHYDGGDDTDLVMYDSVTGSLTADLTVTLNASSETSTVTDSGAGVTDDDTFINFENVRLGDGDDTITVNALGVNVDGDVGTADKIDLSNISTDTTFSFASGLASSNGANATFTNMEVVEFGAGNDTLSLTSLDQSSDGGDGSNVLNASGLNTGVSATVTSGDVTLSDGTTTATHDNYGSLTATGSSDTISLGIGSAVVDGGAGTDTVALTYNTGGSEESSEGSEGGESLPTNLNIAPTNSTGGTVTFGTDLKNVETLDLTSLTQAEATTDINVASADVLSSTSNGTLTILGSATENAANVILDDGWSSSGTDPASGLGIYTNTNGAVLHLDSNALSGVTPSIRSHQAAAPLTWTTQTIGRTRSPAQALCPMAMTPHC